MTREEEALRHLREARREVGRAVACLLAVALEEGAVILERRLVDLAVRIANEYLLGLLSLEEELGEQLAGGEET